MAVWQLFAACVAVALVALFVLRIVRFRRRSELADLLLTIPIPVLGFLVYAASPGRMPEFNLLTWLATALTVLGLFPVFIGGRAIRALMSATVNAAELRNANRYVLVARAFLALGISGYVGMFEPWFGIANLALLTAWVAIWIPTKWRRLDYQATADIAAPPSSVFAFLVEPLNWKAYQVDLESVEVSPPGPLQVGSEVTTRRKFSMTTAPSKPAPELLESRAVITSLVPGESFTAAGGDGSTSMTEVQTSTAGSRLSVRARGVIPFSSALLGLALEAPPAVAVRRQTTMRSLERLGQALGAGKAGQSL